MFFRMSTFSFHRMQFTFPVYNYSEFIYKGIFLTYFLRRQALIFFALIIRDSFCIRLPLIITVGAKYNCKITFNSFMVK